MVDGETASPTWKFTQYVAALSSPQPSFLIHQTRGSYFGFTVPDLPNSYPPKLHTLQQDLPADPSRSGALAIRAMWKISQKVCRSFRVSSCGCFIILATVVGSILTCAAAADIISTVEFDHTGNYLATGDKGGRVVLFERNETASLPSPVWRINGRVLTALPLTEEDLRVQVPHRVSISRARVRLPEITGDRGENQQDQVVQATERLALFALNKRQDHQAVEGV